MRVAIICVVKVVSPEHKTVAAGVVETFAVDHVRQILKAPEIVATAWQNLKDDNVDNDKAVQTLRNIDHLWDNLFPIEQQRICQLLVKTLWFGKDGMRLDVFQDGLSTLLTSTVIL